MPRDNLDINSELRPHLSWAEAVLESISDGVTIQDTELRIIWANRTLKMIFGEDIVGRYCYEVYKRQPKPCVGCLVLEAMESGKTAFGIHTGVDEQGKTWWADIAATPLRDAKGKVVAAVEVVQNITERKLLEEAADRKQREISALATLTTKLSALLSRKAAMQEALSYIVGQGYMEAGIGYCGDGVGALTLSGLAGALRKPKVIKTTETDKALSRMFGSGEVRVKQWTGKLPKALEHLGGFYKTDKKPYFTTVTAGYTDECSGLLIFGSNRLMDDSELQAFQSMMAAVVVALSRACFYEQVGLSERRYRKLFEEAPVGMLVIDAAGVVKAANQSLNRILGRKGDKGLIGLSLDSVPSVVQAGLAKQVGVALSGETVELHGVPFVSIAGKKLVISVRAVPLNQDNGKRRGVVIWVSDDTPLYEAGLLKPKKR